jgi:hypothetical protein
MPARLLFPDLSKMPWGRPNPTFTLHIHQHADTPHFGTAAYLVWLTGIGKGLQVLVLAPDPVAKHFSCHKTHDRLKV